MSKALDTAEQLVVIGLGAGILYGGYRLYKGLQSAALHLPDVGPIGPVISTREYIGPSGQKCKEEIGTLGTSTSCGPIPEPDNIKKAPRDERIRYWIDHSTDPAGLLEALKSAGEDPDLERQVFMMAALRQASSGRLVAAGKKSWDDDDRAFQDVMAWWAKTRGDDRARAAAQAKNWRALVGIAADFCQIDPRIFYGEALGAKWTEKDCAELRAYAEGA